MVIFATTKAAYSEMKKFILSGEYLVWLASNVLSDHECEVLWKEKGISLSLLDYEVDTTCEEDMECALSTIKEHHLGLNIWVQIEHGN